MDISFIKFYNEVLKGEKFKGLGIEAKVIYCCMLDRVSLSEKNGWQDSRGRVFIYFTRAEIASILECSERSANRVFKRLKDAALISQGKCTGKSKPIYVKIFPVQE